MSIVPDYVDLLDTHGEGSSFITNITGGTSLAEIPIREEEDAAAAATSSGSSVSSPIRKLPMDVTKTGTVKPVTSITNQKSSIAGSPSYRLEVSPDE